MKNWITDLTLLPEVWQVRKTTTVGVIVPDVTNMYFASLARGIDDVATMYKYNIILTNSDSNGEKEVNVLNTLLSKQVDGIIFMGNEITDKLREEFKRTKTPIVLPVQLMSRTSMPELISTIPPLFKKRLRT